MTLTLARSALSLALAASAGLAFAQAGGAGGGAGDTSLSRDISTGGNSPPAANPPLGPRVSDDATTNGGRTTSGSSMSGSRAGSSTLGSSATRSGPFGSTAPYIGLNVGQTRFDANCNAAFACDRNDTFAKIYAGASFNPWLGLEVAYLHFGKAGLNGGESKAQALNLSLVARAPINERFFVFGKLGTTYARAESTAAPAAGVTTGRHRGWGPGVGLGVGMNITENVTAVAEWERHRVNFSDARRNLNAASVGVRWNF